METQRLTTGTGGEPLGTERLSAHLTLPGLGSTDPARAFEREIERAAKRTRGEGLEARRREEMTSARRASRRAGFGAERAQDPARARANEPPRALPPAAVPAASPGSGAVEPARAATDGPGAGVPSSTRADPGPGEAGAAPPERQPPGGGPGFDGAARPLSTTVAGAAARAAARPLAAVEARAPAASSADHATATTRPNAGGAVAPERGSPMRGSDAALLSRAEQVLDQIRLHAAPGVKRLTIDIEPADLGRLSIQLALRAGRVTAIVRAGEARTLEMLESRDEELRALLDERGVHVDSLTFVLGFASTGSRRDPRAGTPRTPHQGPQPEPLRGSSVRLDTLA